jgi:hypothetical protein
MRGSCAGALLTSLITTSELISLAHFMVGRNFNADFFLLNESICG